MALALAAPLTGCRRESPPEGRVRLVLRYQPFWGDPAPFRALLEGFERENPGVSVDAQAIPNASDLAHQLLLTALEGGGDLDVFVLDVIWAAEFARAGWLADLSEAFPPARLRDELLPGPVQTAVQGGRTFAVPWYVDVGVLYWRTDLVPRAPRTYRELGALARQAMARDPALRGFVWQGRQYEGLSCNAFEAIWGHGGEPFRDGRLVLDSAAAREALAWLREIVDSGLSPPSVTTAAEEESRRVFQDGRAVFMRNWPYALALLEAPGSRVRGRVAIAPLPSVDGEPGPGALGGWHLGVSARLPPARRAVAERLVAHLTSPEAALTLALAYGRNPARRALYADPRLRAGAPGIAALEPLLARARPRPVTPYYGLVADALQGELSAAVAGLRSPAEALRRAQAQVDHIVGVR
jgi:multiple sugar transport system substrate-binding protein